MSQIATVPLSQRHLPRESNVKETIEQILVAFILAFIFRCFIVEAFVIPTGSMATTLLGAHMDFRCPDCGWHWNINYSGRGSGGDVRVPAQAAEVYHSRCPNCGFKLPKVLPGDPANDASQPVIQYGDRILVQKYLYLLRDPARWDVVVFKNPDLPTEGSERFTDNYIKRLVGLPGETLMVLDGDIYVSKSDKPVEQLAPEDFVVQTKPLKQQEALWRVVYDNDHPPRGLPRADGAWVQPWRAEGPGWDLDDARRFTFDGQAPARLRFDPGTVPGKASLTDWLGYNTSYIVGMERAGSNRIDFWNEEYYPARNNVSDVKLALTYRRASGDGPLTLRVTKQRHQLLAELTPDRVRLLLIKPDESTPIELGKAPLNAGDAPIRVELWNVDYRASIRIDGREVLASKPEDFRPDVGQLLADFEARIRQAGAEVSVDAQDQRAELSHVSLWRDLYYLNENPVSKTYWAMPDNFPKGRQSRQLVRLGADEFFTMGDNSMLSSDARCWMTPIALKYENLAVQAGRVPRRFLLGRAFFVYWPAGYAPVSVLPGFVPNFGEMRFIH
jgi:signal peptidase I